MNEEYRRGVYDMDIGEGENIEGRYKKDKPIVTIKRILSYSIPTVRYI